MKDVHHNASAFSCEPRTQPWLRLEVSALSNSNVQVSELPTDVPILADNPPLDALCIVLLQLPATNIPDSCIFTRPALGFVWLILFTRAVANRDQDRSLASVSGVWLLTRSCACPAQLPPQPKLTGDRLFLHSVRQGRYHPQGRPKAMCLGNRQCKAGIFGPWGRDPPCTSTKFVALWIEQTYYLTSIEWRCRMTLKNSQRALRAYCTMNEFSSMQAPPPPSQPLLMRLNCLAFFFQFV